jgi:hypothetical protein
MVVVKDHQQQEPSMGDITTIGLDLAKSVFQGSCGRRGWQDSDA